MEAYLVMSLKYTKQYNNTISMASTSATAYCYPCLHGFWSTVILVNAVCDAPLPDHQSYIVNNGKTPKSPWKRV